MLSIVTHKLTVHFKEIKIGNSFCQAALPQCKPELSPSQMPEECQDYEEIKWRPNRVQDSDLIMYLQAARWGGLEHAESDGGVLAG